VLQASFYLSSGRLSVHQQVLKQPERSNEMAGKVVSFKTAMGSMHSSMIFGRRVSRLGALCAKLLPENASVLDVGTGDGTIASIVMSNRPDVRVQGIDVHPRPSTKIPVTIFDGKKIPFEANSFDSVMVVDVLHHTDDPASMLKEIARVSSSSVIIKDHTIEGFLARPTLRLMDWVGNAPHGVRLPYNYFSINQWQRGFADAGLSIDSWKDDLQLYNAPFTWFFDRKLHFIAKLVKRS
jgi:SAM-dependent methyltransferase